MALSETVIVSSMGAVILVGFIVFSVLLWRIYSNPALSAAFLPSNGTPSSVFASTGPSKLAPLGTFIWNFFVYLPTALLTFGILVDVINQDFRYMIATLIGLAAIFLNKIFGMGIDKWSGRSSNVVGDVVAEVTGAITAPIPTSYANCIVPGFESFESMYMPQSILLTTTIFTYFLFDFATVFIN